MKYIHLFFVLLSFSAFAQLPVSHEQVQEILIKIELSGEDLRLSYISEWTYELSSGKKVLQIKGATMDGRRFVMQLNGIEEEGKWIMSGESESCIGTRYCKFNDYGCDGCSYRYTQKKFS